MRRSLWATLHDGTLERIVVEDGLVTLTFDVPHVRDHAALGDQARFVLRARGAVSLAALAWNDPAAPRPTSSDAAEAKAWRALGTMRSLAWETFATTVAASGLAVVEAEIEQPESGSHLLLLGGDLAPTWYWVEVRIEASDLSFAHETGVSLPLDTLEALGEAYWSAWNERRSK